MSESYSCQNVPAVWMSQLVRVFQLPVCPAYQSVPVGRMSQLSECPSYPSIPVVQVSELLKVSQLSMFQLPECPSCPNVPVVYQLFKCLICSIVSVPGIPVIGVPFGVSHVQSTAKWMILLKGVYLPISNLHSYLAVANLAWNGIVNTFGGTVYFAVDCTSFLIDIEAIQINFHCQIGNGIIHHGIWLLNKI